MLVKKLDPNAMLPVKMPGSAAYDLYSNERVLIYPGNRAIIGTGLAISFKRNYVGRICDRSGMAWSAGLHVLAGVIDPNYRGEWKVVLLNTSDSDVRLQAGTRIAQVLFYEVADWGIEEVDELSDTERGAGGFGSTGDR
jgi:dUTP pyrophosphatase